MNRKIGVKDDLIFSLDIGTRTIIGLVCKENEENQLEIIEYAIREHEERNMYDGQIHDISGVASLVGELVNELEGKLGGELKRVSVAAAGRALKTERTMAEILVDDNKKINDFDISTLEIKALQKAQELISSSNEITAEYYNIGYSIVEYYLDETAIDNLKGHKGNKIGVEILATFLPKIVIEGLYSVIEEVGLEVDSVTLEPIAAINVSIEKDLRILNLVLVDIGAGTSDIAITKERQIIYYGMTQTAGDEITETLLKKYLLDFNSSEMLKRDISKKEEHTVKNILGMEQVLTNDELFEALEETLNLISKNIAEEILEYNGKKPDAIFLIGGTSQMPTLKEKIAEEVGIPIDRISVRDLTHIKNIVNTEKINRPDMVTPLGIAVEGLENKYRNFLNIRFNNESIQLFNTGNVKVSDILVLTNFEPKNLIPKWGDDLIYYRNGKKRMKKGMEGSRPKILINDELGSLQQVLKDGDEIVITESIIPKRTPLYIKDVIPKDIDMDFVLVNGKSIDEDYIVQNGDNIEIIEIDKIKNKVIKLDEKKEKLEKKEIKKNNKVILLNVNGESKKIEYKEEPFRFVDIFDHINFDRSKAKGKLCLSINGEKAEYLQTLKDGDNLEIYWS